MTFAVDKVRYFTATGAKRFEYVERTNQGYYSQRCRWAEEHGLALPLEPTLDTFGDRRDLRILCEPVEIFIKFGDSSWVEFMFDRGFITDLASVPRFLRGVVDQDDPAILPAVLVHDYLFATHRLPFDFANELFHRMMVANGYSKGRAWLAWFAVASPFGRRAWKNNRDQWTRTRVGFFMPRPVTIDGRRYEGDKWES